MHGNDMHASLQAYADGELSPERAAHLERHIASCAECQAEWARLQAVTEALESWPLVTEPGHLAASVMARVRARPAPPRFRHRWSDVAISAMGGGLAFVTALVLRYLSPTVLGRARSAQLLLQSERLRLQLLRLTPRLTRIDPAAWGMAFVGLTLCSALALLLWDMAAWRRWVLHRGGTGVTPYESR
jgi:anti-sigma factor RsiW